MNDDSQMPGWIAPPAASVSGLTVGAVLARARTRNEGQLTADLTRALQVGQPLRRLVDLAGDGSPKIPSLVAVWLISQVAAAVGIPKLVDIGKVRRESLRSLAGVAQLLHAAMHPADGQAKAS